MQIRAISQKLRAYVSAALKTALLYVIKKRRGGVRGKTNVSANCCEVSRAFIIKKKRL